MKPSEFFDDFLVPKKVISKNIHSGASVTDCFEPIFGFFRSFWFEKCRSAPWNRIGMFSELTRFPLPRFLAYVRVSGGISAGRGPQYSPTNTNFM